MQSGNKESIKKNRYCAVCGQKKVLDGVSGNNFCLFCEKETPNKYLVTVAETLNVHDQVKMLKKSTGYKKFAVSVIKGWFSSHSHKDGVDIYRIIDKENDEYHEVVEDKHTGTILHQSHEKLANTLDMEARATSSRREYLNRPGMERR